MPQVWSLTMSYDEMGSCLERAKPMSNCRFMCCVCATHSPSKALGPDVGEARTQEKNNNITDNELDSAPYSDPTVFPGMALVATFVALRARADEYLGQRTPCHHRGAIDLCASALTTPLSAGSAVFFFSPGIAQMPRWKAIWWQRAASQVWWAGVRTM